MKTLLAPLLVLLTPLAALPCRFLVWAALCGYVAFSVLAEAALPASRLSGSRAVLTLDERGLSIIPGDTDRPVIVAAGTPLWKITLQAASRSGPFGKCVEVSSADQQPRIEQTDDGIRVVYDALTDGKREWKIRLILEISRNGEGFQIGGALHNQTDDTVISEFEGPVLSGIRADPSRYDLYWPTGLGLRVTASGRTIRGDQCPRFWPENLWQRGDGGEGRVGERSFVYPACDGTMQWCAFASLTAGLYIGCHDADHGMKAGRVRFFQDKQSSFWIEHLPYCAPGQRWTLPPLVVIPYTGDWHAAARSYRAWFDSVTSLWPIPKWARDASGWLLVILKQQNGEVMWKYSDLEKLCDVADERGLDMLGLFGWAEGGHDRAHPEAIPDPKMGGEEALRQGLALARRRGKHVILYTNGRRMDDACDYYRRLGRQAAVLDGNGRQIVGGVQKYQDVPAVQFVLACNGSADWRKEMLRVAINAHRLGAAGILYDELATQNPACCFVRDHLHSSPATAFTSCRSEMLRNIANHMQTLSPDFIVMTEGMHDSVLDSISYFHGYGVGFWSPAQAAGRLSPATVAATFPEMFRYTFPEIPMTIRHNTPMMDRRTVNHVCMYGMRYELESRYAPDALYLRDGVIPAIDAYQENTAPPMVSMIRGTPPAEAAHYLKQVIAFMRANADFFWQGRFLDDQGFQLTGANLRAKGYAAGDRLAVLVWNPTSHPAEFSVGVPRADCVGAAEPGRKNIEPLSPLAPETVRLLEWRKQP